MDGRNERSEPVGTVNLETAFRWILSSANNWVNEPKKALTIEVRIETFEQPLLWLLRQSAEHRMTFVSLPSRGIVLAGIGQRSFAFTETDKPEGAFPTPIWYDSAGRRFKPIVLFYSHKGENRLRVYIPVQGRSQGCALIQELYFTERIRYFHSCYCSSTLKRVENSEQLSLKEMLSFELSHVIYSIQKEDFVSIYEGRADGGRLQLAVREIFPAGDVDTLTEPILGFAVCLLQNCRVAGFERDTLIHTHVSFVQSGPSVKVVGKNWGHLITRAPSEIFTQPNINSLWGSAVVEELLRNGVDTFFIAPGSRSTPLVYGVHVNKSVKHYLVHDERGAGFMALNHGKLTGLPAAVIVTSGTAVANLLPSVVEAANSGIPMLLLTADRPPELRDNGAPQTIDQVKIFGSFVRFFSDIPCPSDEVPLKTVLGTVDHGVRRSISPGVSGPVHLNFMFREKLSPDPENFNQQRATAGLYQWQNGSRTPLTLHAGLSRIRDPTVACRTLMRLLRTTRRVLIIAGSGLSMVEASALKDFSKKLSCPIVPDILSGLRFHGSKFPRISFMDQLLMSPKVREKFDEPFVALQFGERVLSKRVNSLLGGRRTVRVLVSSVFDRFDDCQNLDMVIETDPKLFIARLFEMPHLPKLDEFYPLTEASARLCTFFQDYSAKMDGAFLISEPMVAMTISRILPQGSTIFVSNSMPIRDLNAYGFDRHYLKVYSNRGANGIDGIVSSALGVLLAAEEPVYLIIGDMAFLHDLNALHSVRELMNNNSVHPIRIIVLNNSGGGIFSFLPIEKHKEFHDKFFHAGHNVSVEGVCGDFKIPYANAKIVKEMHEKFQWMLQTTTSCVLELSCIPANKNRNIHEAITTAVEQKISEEFKFPA